MQVCRHKTCEYSAQSRDISTVKWCILISIITSWCQASSSATLSTENNQLDPSKPSNPNNRATSLHASTNQSQINDNPRISQIHSIGRATEISFKNIGHLQLLQQSSTTRSIRSPQQAAGGLISEANWSTGTELRSNDEQFRFHLISVCLRDSMVVRIRVNRPFYGVVHARNWRHKATCSIEAEGGQEYELLLSFTLNPNDPKFCGLFQMRKQFASDPDTLAAVIAVRLNRNIELSEDKYFLFNCTRKKLNEKLRIDTNEGGESTNYEELERVDSNQQNRTRQTASDCSIWKFPWLVYLFWSLAFILFVSLVAFCSYCILTTCCISPVAKNADQATKSSIQQQDNSSKLGESVVRSNRKRKRRRNGAQIINYTNPEIYGSDTDANSLTQARGELLERQATRSHRSDKLSRNFNSK